MTRVERIGPELEFELIVQSVVIAVFDGLGRQGEAAAEGGQVRKAEQERKHDDKAEASRRKHGAKEMAGRSDQNNPPRLRSL